METEIDTFSLAAKVNDDVDQHGVDVLGLAELRGLLSQH